MIYIFVSVVIILIIVFFLNSSKKQLKAEILNEGGLNSIFPNLELALFEQGFTLYQNNISSIEYHNKINDYSFLKCTIKKTFDSNNPYQMQMMHVLSGKINQKTIPYIISPKASTQEFDQELVRMLQEIMNNQVSNSINK